MDKIDASSGFELPPSCVKDDSITVGNNDDADAAATFIFSELERSRHAEDDGVDDDDSVASVRMEEGAEGGAEDEESPTPVQAAGEELQK